MTEPCTQIYASCSLPNANLALSEPEQKNLHEKAKKINGYVGYFYKIKDAHNKTVGYLCGTLHACEGALFSLSQPINRAILKSNKIFLENENPSQILEERQKNTYALIQQKSEAALTAAVSLYEVEIHQRENNFGWKKIKIDHGFDTLSPFEQFKLCRKHYDFIVAREVGKEGIEINIEGIDDFIYAISKKLQKDVFGLETMDDDLMADLQRVALMTSVDLSLQPNIDREKRCYLAGSKQWLSGTIVKPKPIKDIVSEENQMLWQMTCARSEKFARIIINDLRKEQGRSFYAFGFSHLYNQRSVIDLLQAHNFKVIRC